MILLIDNFDSFVFNLARYVGELGHERQVVRTDAISVEEALALDPQAIILSPGPCGPDEAGISVALARAAGSIPVLGVCLGHQAIAAAFGAEVGRAPRPVHGKSSSIRHQGHALFEGIGNPFIAARYHSLSVTLPGRGPLLPLAEAEDDGTLMALAHETRPLYGVQFHPESVLTGSGHRLIANFLKLGGIAPARTPRAA